MKWDANQLYALLLGSGRLPEITYLPAIPVVDAGPVADMREAVMPRIYDGAAKLARLQTLDTLLRQPEVAEIMAEPRERLAGVSQTPDVFRLSAVTKTQVGAAPCGLLVRKAPGADAGLYAGQRKFTLSKVDGGLLYADGYGSRTIPVADAATSVQVMNGAVELGITPDSGEGAWTVGVTLSDHFDVAEWVSIASANQPALFQSTRHANAVSELYQLFARSRTPHIRAAAALGALVYALEESND